jgi:hypothetical protein
LSSKLGSKIESLSIETRLKGKCNGIALISISKEDPPFLIATQHMPSRKKHDLSLHVKKGSQS